MPARPSVALSVRNAQWRRTRRGISLGVRSLAPTRAKRESRPVSIIGVEYYEEKAHFGLFDTGSGTQPAITGRGWHITPADEVRQSQHAPEFRRDGPRDHKKQELCTVKPGSDGLLPDSTRRARPSREASDHVTRSLRNHAGSEPCSTSLLPHRLDTHAPLLLRNSCKPGLRGAARPQPQTHPAS
jgi:hypothetical protein